VHVCCVQALEGAHGLGAGTLSEVLSWNPALCRRGVPLVHEEWVLECLKQWYRLPTGEGQTAGGRVVRMKS